MVVIYSDKKRAGLEGVYADPALFDGNTENCTLVYADDPKIVEAYTKKGIEVTPFTKAQKKLSDMLDKG